MLDIRDTAPHTDAMPSRRSPLTPDLARKLHEHGQTAEQIAAEHSVRLSWVRRWIAAGERGRPRVPDDQQLVCDLRARVTQREYDAAKAAAERAGGSLAEYVRDVVAHAVAADGARRKTA